MRRIVRLVQVTGKSYFNRVAGKSVVEVVGDMGKGGCGGGDVGRDGLVSRRGLQ